MWRSTTNLEKHLDLSPPAPAKVKDWGDVKAVRQCTKSCFTAPSCNQPKNLGKLHCAVMRSFLMRCSHIQQQGAVKYSSSHAAPWVCHLGICHVILLPFWPKTYLQRPNNINPVFVVWDNVNHWLDVLNQKQFSFKTGELLTCLGFLSLNPSVPSLGIVSVHV